MSDNQKKQDLKDRLYAELKASTTESEEFKSAFRYIQELDKEDQADPEIDALNKEHLKIKIEKDRIETEKLKEPEPVESFMSKHANVLIPAVGTLSGILVIVCAEVFGQAIMNSKAMNRLQRP